MAQGLSRAQLELPQRSSAKLGLFLLSSLWSGPASSICVWKQVILLGFVSMIMFPVASSFLVHTGYYP